MVAGRARPPSERLLRALFELMPPSHLVYCNERGASGKAIAMARERGIPSTQFWHGVQGQTPEIAAGQILACKRPDLILAFSGPLSKVVLLLKAAGVPCLRPRGKKKWRAA